MGDRLQTNGSQTRNRRQTDEIQTKTDDRQTTTSERQPTNKWDTADKNNLMGKRQTRDERETDDGQAKGMRQTVGRQTDGQTGRQADRQTDRETAERQLPAPLTVVSSHPHR